MNDKSVMGEVCPVGRPSVISCQPSAKDTSQKKKVFKDKKEALSRLASNIDNKSTQFVGSLPCPSLEDGFGGSINIGRNSMGTRGELHGKIPHRVHLQFRSSWQVGDRTGRSEVGRAKVIQRALKPYTIYLTALNVLFCVCLAHARQSSSPEAAHGVAFQKSYPITGTVLNAADDTPLDGATVSIKGKQNIVLTNADGKFRILATDSTSVLVISYVGYQTAEIPFTKSNNNPLTIRLESNGTQLEEVQVSTGYQTLPKERATGSFVQIDNELLNRRVSTNILDRLDGVTSGLIFNKNPESRSPITIRGNSTIFANPSPLIVLDNYPYEGDPANINPNDIESVSVLKDAAAASIWGVRAGNGVIVITTKKGTNNAKPSISLNSNLTVGQKPNLYYPGQLSSAEFIEVEKFLFGQGFYWNIADGFSAISPVVSMLHEHQMGRLDDAQLDAELAALGNKDVRNDLDRYIYRRSINQQYALNIAGGGKNNRYFISGGYDKNVMNLVSDSRERFTLTANNTIDLNDRLSVTTGMILTNASERRNNSIYTVPRYPYESLADDNGNPLATIKDLRSSFIDTAGNGKLLNWQYIPLNERHPNQHERTTDYRFNASLDYKLIPSLQFSGSYLYQKGVTQVETNNSVSSYYTRNMINSYSRIDPSSGEMVSPVPYGTILDRSYADYRNHVGRMQLSFSRDFGPDHSINAIAGFEIREYRSFGTGLRHYGYNNETATNANASINFNELYAQFYGWSSLRIPANTHSSGSVDRNRSFYANASYRWKSRYIFSGSMRRDEANIFGVKTNQKGVPLWSAGLSWDVGNEPFFNSGSLSQLKLRATYGYNGNTDRNTTAFLTVLADAAINSFGRNYYLIMNPPNPSLRWEKVGVLNMAVDFASRKNRVNGSIEYYRKSSRDLIANSPISPQTGLTSFRGNSANMVTNGLDIQLTTVNIDRVLKWKTQWLLNYVKDKVTGYRLRPPNNRDIVRGNYSNPLEGFPLNALFGFPYAGLNENGDPRGYLNGNITQDYRAIATNTDPSNLTYLGTSSPQYFGSIINTFDYGNWNLSVNIVYRSGYHFRKPGINFGDLPANYRQADFANRWQQPGDEQHTTVPRMVYPADQYRDLFYTYSNVLVERGDHVRLQDIRLGYTINGGTPQRFWKRLQLYVYANNLGLLWTASRADLDPDSPTGIPPSKSFSLGLMLDF
ncbi:MAG: SusC/RagA family TonB-linked outer membrane protein [Olivibacter sp.]|nr:SusC/RagA family TonB-linked outer membrane protein [Olivibacter sp. UJ_SKK_5.1]